jgi:cellulose synthase/poly-beta-1,6-N-acetylglucosamine synthase-like glycosyltransferase
MFSSDDALRTSVTAVYFLLVVGMAIFAFHKVKMLTLYAWSRRLVRKVPPSAPEFTPKVCVQCPLYNEPLMVEDLLAALAALRWPQDRLTIQLLDDSNDETPERITAWLAKNPAAAKRIVHVRRARRTGYKAGALAHGMTKNDAEFFAIFDADFRPSEDFLETLMPHFAAAPEVGLVQARWEFSNRRASLLTQFQAIFLDAHFLVEQAARHAMGLFFNFNGTAGIWRRAALEEAGGWTPDTVTEDLDVSYRAQLRGWRFVYCGDYAVPSELPENLTAFKSQQRRWTKGGIQVMRKQLATILRAPRVAGRVKREAAWHLTVGFIHPLLAAFAVLLVPYFVWGTGATNSWLDWVQPTLLTFTLWVTLGMYLAGRRLLGGNAIEALVILLAAPMILSFGLAMCLTNTVAVAEGLWQRGGEFVRTPKGGGASSVSGVLERLRHRWLHLGIGLAELVLGGVLASGATHFGIVGQPMVALLLGSKAAGFLVLGTMSLNDMRPRAAAA